MKTHNTYYFVSPLDIYLDPDSSKYSFADGIEDNVSIPSIAAAHAVDAIRKQINISFSYSGDNKPLLSNWNCSPALRKKLSSLKLDVQVLGDELCGIAALTAKQELSTKELHEVSAFLSQEYSDGWGEGFAMIPIESKHGDIYIHFWSDDPAYHIDIYTQDEWNQFAEMESCF